MDEDEEIDVQGRNEMASEVWQFMTAPTGITALKSVAIYVGRHDQHYLTKISGTTLSQLQDAADNAAACGVSFRVIGKTRREGTITEEILVNNVPTTRGLLRKGESCFALSHDMTSTRIIGNNGAIDKAWQFYSGFNMATARTV
jgi:hypothetical protein